VSENDWKMWDLRSGKLIRQNSATRTKLAVFTRAGSGIVVDEDGTIVLLDEPKTDRFALIRTGMIQNFMSVSPDGLRIATPTAFEKDNTRPAQPDRSFQIRDARTGALVRTVRGHTDSVSMVTFSPDGKRLLSAAADGSARTWDASTGEPLVVMEHGSAVRNAQFSPDGTRVLTITSSDEVSCWDSATGQRLGILQGHLGQVLSASFSPDGTRVVTTGLDGTAKIFSATVADLVRTYLTTAFRLLRHQPEYQQVKEIDRDLPTFLRAFR
jgi:WD40 repeat protein